VNLGYFYRLEKPARVRLVRLNQLASPPSPDRKIFKSVPFSMQITGSYRNTLSFVRALETGSRILRIRSCSFERSASDANEFVVDLTVDALAKL
jgi:Tfp pilus assembly protein PilO